ncbi:hypothetical protein ACN6K5_002184 [Streptomyces violaceoruber]|uniref:hypothetical protein n=1 Tax=Streptomyces violaceoruber group TaxID=2867121 RepID=UPI0033E30DAA
MTDRLEWAHVSSPAELLYPGRDIDGATVEPGEIAVAMWTGSNGIAVHGPWEEVRDRFLQLAAAVDNAPPVRAEGACIAEHSDPPHGQLAQTDPEPGTEYVFVLSDYAHAAARALGRGWCGESGFLGAWGLVFCLEEPDCSRLEGRAVRLFVDGEGDLCVGLHDDVVLSSEWHYIPTEDLPEFAPRSPDELTVWGEVIASAIRRHYLD